MSYSRVLGRLTAVLLSLLLFDTANAQSWRKGGIGMGVVLGQPTGLTLESRLSRSSSIDLAIGFNTFDNSHNDNGYAHLEYLVRFFSLSHSRRVSIPLYIGAGVFVSEHDDVHTGVRFPLGLNFEFRSPVQFFLELSVRAVLISDHDSSDLDLGSAGGFRVFF